MGIVYKKLTDTDLNTFIKMRINQLREEGAKEDIDLTPALKDYYQVCIQIQNTDGKELLKNCLIEL